MKDTTKPGGDGKPLEPDSNKPDPNAAPPPEYVPKADFEALRESNKKLAETVEQLNLRMQDFGQPSAPAAPSGPSETEKLQEQIRTKEAEMTALNKQFDEAYTNAQPLGDIISKKDRLAAEIGELRSELRLQPKITQLELAGGQALEQLSETVTSAQMPHLKVPEVKRSFDNMMKTLAPNARMNPAVRKQVYNFAVGENLDTIVSLRDQEAARQAAEHIETQQAGGGGTGRQNAQPGAEGGVPKPEDILSRENIDAIRAVGKSVDGYYQTLGYKSWADFWEKTGKEYYEEGEEA